MKAKAADESVREPDSEELLRDYLQMLESGKALYQQADEVLAELTQRLRQVRGVRRLTHPETGELYELVDVFKEKNIAWGHAKVSRWKLEKVKAPKAAKS